MKDRNQAIRMTIILKNNGETKASALVATKTLAATTPLAAPPARYILASGMVASIARLPTFDMNIFWWLG